MKTYRLQDEVPWKEVTRILYWYLHMEIRHAGYQQERGDRRALEPLLFQIRQDCETVRSLRRFLGYPGTTKWEREAVKLLESEAREP